jgi:hypothetical protein
MTWLFYPSVATSIFVWGKLGDAQADIEKQEQVFARVRARLQAAREAGHQMTGGPPRVGRVANIVFIAARFANGEPKRLKAALAELAKTN